MDFLAPLLLDAMLTPAPHTLCRSASSDSRPTLEEHADGWVITALMPGMDASQVSVETLNQDDGSQLWLHAEPRFKTELRCVPVPQRCTQRARAAGRARAGRSARGSALCARVQRRRFPAGTFWKLPSNAPRPLPRRLPRNADVSKVQASLLNGVLTVAVPKKAPETFAVTVESSPLPDDLSEPRAQVSLALPGLAASDLSVVISRDRSLLLHVKGSSTAFGNFHEVLRLPERADAEQARAAMVNGVFSFSVPVPPEPTTDVPVLAALPAEAMETEAPAENNKDGCKDGKTQQPVLLLEAAAPGLCAADFKASVSGRTLTLAADKSAMGGRRVRRTVLLPPHTAPGAVVVTCVHGLLRATAPRLQPPARSAVEISSTETAALLKAPGTPPGTPTAVTAAPMEEAPMEEAH
jgi:HSP20 family molecular chaperone IbpA